MEDFGRTSKEVGTDMIRDNRASSIKLSRQKVYIPQRAVIEGMTGIIRRLGNNDSRKRDFVKERSIIHLRGKVYNQSANVCLRFYRTREHADFNRAPASELGEMAMLTYIVYPQLGTLAGECMPCHVEGYIVSRQAIILR